MVTWWVWADGHTHTHTRHNTMSFISFPFQISKLVTWEVVLSVGAVFGLLFGYERLTWTDSAKERAVKEQVGTLGGEYHLFSAVVRCVL